MLVIVVHSRRHATALERKREKRQEGWAQLWGGKGEKAHFPFSQSFRLLSLKMEIIMNDHEVMCAQHTV